MLDSDDLWLPRYLERMVGALKAHPQAGFAYTDAWAYEQLSDRFRRASAMSRQRPPRRELEPTEFLRELVRRNFIFNSVTVRKAVLDDVGGYDTSFAQAEDYELWLRICASGYAAVLVDGRAAIGRDRPGSLSHDSAAMRAGLLKAYRAVVERHPAPQDVKQIARERCATIVGGNGHDGARSLWERARGAVAAAARPVRSRRNC